MGHMFLIDVFQAEIGTSFGYRLACHGSDFIPVFLHSLTAWHGTAWHGLRQFGLRG